MLWDWYFILSRNPRNDRTRVIHTHRLIWRLHAGDAKASPSVYIESRYPINLLHTSSPSEDQRRTQTYKCSAKEILATEALAKIWLYTLYYQLIKPIGQHIPYRKLCTSSFYSAYYMSQWIMCARSEKWDYSIYNIFKY